VAAAVAVQILRARFHVQASAPCALDDFQHSFALVLVPLSGD